FWQIFALLRLAAIAADLVDAKVRVRAIGKPDRSRTAAHLLHRHAMGEIAHARATVFLLDGDAVQSERSHLRPPLHREAVGTVDLGGERRDTIFGKATNRGSQHVDLRTGIKIEQRKPGVMHGRPMSSRLLRYARNDPASGCPCGKRSDEAISGSRRLRLGAV